MRRFTRMALAVATVTGSVAIGSGIAVAATPDVAICTFGSSAGNVQTCVNIISGPQVTATAVIPHSGKARTLLVCVEEPSGILGWCSGFPENTYTAVGPDQGIEAIYPQGGTGTARPGRYCADTFRRNADGTSTMIGQACKHT